MAFVVIALPLVMAMMTPVIGVSLCFSRDLVGRLLNTFRWVFLFSVVSGVFQISLGVLATHPNITLTRPFLKICSNRRLYRDLLLLSGLNALYGLVGIFLLPKRRRLGILVLLLTAMINVIILAEIFMRL